MLGHIRNSRDGGENVLAMVCEVPKKTIFPNYLEDGPVGTGVVPPMLYIHTRARYPGRDFREPKSHDLLGSSRSRSCLSDIGSS